MKVLYCYETDKRENLAKLAHEQWSGWMEYLFSKGMFNSDGTWTMPQWAVDRWKRQMKTDYKDLSESEKNSDRKEADKFIRVMEGKNDVIIFVNILVLLVIVFIDYKMDKKVLKNKQ